MLLLLNCRTANTLDLPPAAQLAPTWTISRSYRKNAGCHQAGSMVTRQQGLNEAKKRRGLFGADHPLKVSFSKATSMQPCAGGTTCCIGSWGTSERDQLA